MPAVTVIVPDWDRHAPADPRVRALLAQDEPDWEAILIPSGASAEPASSSAAESDAAVDPRLRRSDPPDVRGDYFLILGPDDRLEPDALGLLMATARTTGAELVMGDVDEQRADGSMIPARSRSGLIAGLARGTLLPARDPAVFVEDGLRGTLIARRLVTAAGGDGPPQDVDDAAAWAEIVLAASSVAIAVDARVVRSVAPSIVTSAWLDQQERADRRLAAVLSPEARRRQLEDALESQWWPRLREIGTLPADVSGVPITAALRRITEEVRRVGAHVGWRMAGVLEGVLAYQWAERPLRDERGADLNPVAGAVAERGVEERARRIRVLVETGRVGRGWARRYFEDEVIGGAARLSDDERALVRPSLVAAAEQLYPGRSRWELLPTTRMRLGAWRRGVRSTAQLLDQAIDSKSPPEGRTDGAGRGRPVAVFPNWSDANPLLDMLWSVPHERGRRLVGLRARSRSLAWLRASDEPALIHLHWTDPIIGDAPDEAAAASRADEFMTALDTRLRAGSRLIWTVHNVRPHEAAAPAASRRLHAALARRASAVHVMTRGTVDAARDDYALPVERIRYIPHASYRDSYGPPPDRDAARELLGVPSGATTVLVFGRLRHYKGLDAVVDAVAERRRAGQPLHVLLAGQPASPAEGEELEAAFESAGAGVTSGVGFVDPELVPAWFAAADVIALPYTRVLNSGTILLAATFGLPVIATRSAGLHAEYGDAAWVRFVDPEAPAAGLALELADSSWYCDPETRRAASEFAATRTVAGMSAAYADLLDELDPSDEASRTVLTSPSR